MRDSEHFFFDLPSFSEMLQAYPQRRAAGAGGEQNAGVV